MRIPATFSNNVESKTQYGTVDYNGETLILDRNAEATNAATGGVEYVAKALDSEGNAYQINWDIRDDFKNGDIEDEGEACDWDNCTVTEL